MSGRANTYDVVVAGAGPAGAVATCLLARAGLSVLICDPRLGFGPKEPAKPGEALPGAATRLLQAYGLPLPETSGCHTPIGGNISAWGYPEPIYRDFVNEPDGLGWRLDRSAFEAELVAAASAAGVTTLSQLISAVVREGNAWKLETRDGAEWRATWLVDATGRAASVARRLGATRRRDESLVAVIGRARSDPGYRLNRTIVETTPLGWWYAALLPHGGPVFMLHTLRDEAARLVCRPEQWRAELALTTHVAAAFPGAVFDEPLRAHEACGAWLDPIHGPGWVACGDAASSFDPAAAQGIFNALWAGVEVGGAIAAAMRGNLEPLHAYVARIAEIRRIYRERLLTHYASEQRWPDAPFWRERRSGGA